MFKKVIAILIFAAAGSALAQESQPAMVRSRVEPYRLNVDDQILIRAANIPELNEKSVRVDANGFINAPTVGRIQVSGLTAEQLENEMLKRLKVTLENPEVIISVAEFRTQPVSVIGEVNTSGVQQVRGPKTLVEVLSLAGGLRSEAGPTARITRRLEFGRVPLPGALDDETGKFSVAQVNLRALLEAQNPETNILVQPYDVISVPRAQMVYVMGEVAKAGPLPLNENQSISILQAVSSSGGVLRTAAPQHAKILRPIMGGPKRAELPIDIKQILAGKAIDAPLLPGDILLVPGSNSKRASIRALEAAITTGTVIATYGIVR